MSLDNTSPQRIARLTPLAEVLARLDACVKPVKPREIEGAIAAGRILANDVRAASVPRVPLALRDGWAVSSDLTTDASSYAPIPLPAAARIDAGQPMPAGADAIAPLDAVVRRHGQVEIIAPVGTGEGVLAAGADTGRQTIWAQGGRKLTGIQAAVLTAAGAAVHVREPVVRVVSARAVADAVIDAAVALIAGEIVAAGGHALHAVHVRSAAGGGSPLDAALADPDADAVIAVGGTGCGRNDTSVVALARLGRVEAHGIALAPGESAAFGFVEQRPVLLLPGRLDAALAVWWVIGRRLLARLSGSSEPEPEIKVTLARKVASALGVAELVPLRLRAGAAEPLASGHLPLAALTQADGWLLVPAESEGYPPGAEVVIKAWP